MVKVMTQQRCMVMDTCSLVSSAPVVGEVPSNPRKSSKAIVLFLIMQLLIVWLVPTLCVLVCHCHTASTCVMIVFTDYVIEITVISIELTL